MGQVYTINTTILGVLGTFFCSLLGGFSGGVWGVYTLAGVVACSGLVAGFWGMVKSQALLSNCYLLFT